jgi:hypothetical protein
MNEQCKCTTTHFEFPNHRVFRRCTVPRAERVLFALFWFVQASFCHSQKDRLGVISQGFMPPSSRSVREAVELAIPRLVKALEQQDEAVAAEIVLKLHRLRISDADILRSTGVALTVNRVRTVFTNPRLVKLARIVVKGWKEVLCAGSKPEHRQSTGAAQPVPSIVRKDSSHEVSISVRTASRAGVTPEPTKQANTVVQTNPQSLKNSRPAAAKTSLAVPIHDTSNHPAHSAPLDFPVVASISRRFLQSDATQLASSSARRPLPISRSSSVRSVTTLVDVCTTYILVHVDLIQHLGDVPFDLLEPVLSQCTWRQLLRLQAFNPQFTGYTNGLWREVD